MGVRGGVRALKDRACVIKHQADAYITQVAVQNTWYEWSTDGTQATKLGTQRNVRIYGIDMLMNVANETIECRITVDDQVLVGSLAVTFDHRETVFMCTNPLTPNVLTIVADQTFQPNSFLIEGRSVKVEFRKTTATGLNTLNGRVKWAKW